MKIEEIKAKIQRDNIIYLYLTFVSDKDEPLTLKVGTERLQMNAAQFLVRIREECKMSHTAMEKVADGVINLLDIYSAFLMVCCHYYLKADLWPMHFLGNFSDCHSHFSHFVTSRFLSEA